MKREVLTDRPGAVIAEVAQAHDGSLGMAHAFIDAIAGAGADAVKFQTHIAAAESTPSEPWRVKFSPQDETRYDYWRRMEFTEAQWAGSGAARRRARSSLFLSSPFSIEAVELLERVASPPGRWRRARSANADARRDGRHGQAGAAVDRHERWRRSTAWRACGQRARGSRSCSARAPIRARRRRSASTCCPCFRRAVRLPGRPVRPLRDDLPVAGGGDARRGRARGARDAQPRDVRPGRAASLTTAELAQLVRGVRFIERMRAHRWTRMPPPPSSRRCGSCSRRASSRRARSRRRTAEPRCLGAKKPGTGIPADRLPSVAGARCGAPSPRTTCCRSRSGG